jgi:hypothetical protein
VPGCGRGAPPAGAGSQLGPNRSPEGLVGPRARCGKKRGGQGYLLIKRLDIRAKGAPTGLCSAPCIFYSCCPILRGPSGSQRRRGGRVLVPRRQSQTTGLGRRKKQVTCTWCFGVRSAVLGARCASRSCYPLLRGCLLRSCCISQHPCCALTAPRPSLPLPLAAKWQRQRQRPSDRKEAHEAWSLGIVASEKIFGWGCGYKGRWASRGSEGEGGGALDSSHSGRALGRSSTSV